MGSVRPIEDHEVDGGLKLPIPLPLALAGLSQAPVQLGPGVHHPLSTLPHISQGVSTRVM